MPITMFVCGQPTVSDNKHATCPARMSDGRLFTNYSSRCEIQASVVNKRVAQMDSYKTRQYMIHNGNSIIDMQRRNAACAAHCGPCGPNTMLPELEIDSCDTSECTRRTNNLNGLGLGRDYKNNILSRSEMYNTSEISGAMTVPIGGKPLGDKMNADTPWST